MEIWIHKAAKHRWYQYWKPKWLNPITWKKGNYKIYRWLFWGFTL